MKQGRLKKKIVRGEVAQTRVWVTGLRYVGITVVGCVLIMSAFFVFEGRRALHERHGESLSEHDVQKGVLLSFPVSVQPLERAIVDNPDVEDFYKEYISKSEDEGGSKTSFVRRALGKLALMGWYQNLASLSSRILVILPGERKEQVGENFAKILAWSKDDKARFIELIETHVPPIEDGKFYPDTYTALRGASPEEVAALVLGRFDVEVLSRYTRDVETQVPLHDALTIASLLEREAYDFEDMRHISGVIWNRLFVDMRLQIDATLQYAKGSLPSEPWWPRVVPRDKYIPSPYNTYTNEGLPPAPIANPGLASILAALNPIKTECMYYFHDEYAHFHCSKTYDEHVALLKEYYGQGK